MLNKKCGLCGVEDEKLEKCEYCGGEFCREDYPRHMDLERRHEGLAEAEGRFWRRSPDRGAGKI